MDIGQPVREAPRIRHPALTEVLATGLFAPDGDFQGFEAALAALSRGGAPERLVGDIWEVFSEAYLLTEPTMQAEEVWPIAVAPDEVLAALNIGRSDRGCDGVMRRRDGVYVAYQAKFRSGREPLTWGELATFVGWSERAGARLVVTNSDAVSEDALSRDRLMTARGADMRPLDPGRMGEIRSLVKGQRSERPRLKPKPHQEEAVADISAGLAMRDRATVTMACGSGKTLVGLWSAAALGADTVLVLLPSLALVRQTLGQWAREQAWGRSFRFLAVCSDDTVAEGDAVAMRQSDLAFPITTDPAEVRRFLEGHEAGSVSVVFSTYQSATRVASGMPLGMRFALGEFDEAHRTAGHAEGAFGFALDDGNLAIQKRLFLTATRRVHSARVKDKVRLLRSMDDEAVYGPVVHELSFRRAADLRIICPYKVLVAVVTRSDVAAAMRGGEVLLDGVAMDPEEVAARIAFGRAVEAHGLSKAITFHRSIRDAADFAADGPLGAGRFLPSGFRLFHVSGRMQAARRDGVLDGFRAARGGAVSNARCLTEGVDLPAVDLVAFMARKESTIDIVQAIGRALRRPPEGEKEIGYVLVPLFIDEEEGEDLEMAVERSDFGQVWEVLRALMDQDASLLDVVDSLRAGRRTSGGGLGGFVEVIGPAIPLDRLRHAIEVRITDQLGDAFERGFAQLERFVARERHARVSTKHVEEGGYRLGAWVNARRTYRNKLTDSQQERLQALPGWTWDVHDERFEIGMRNLETFAARERHALVPGKHNEGEFPLGAWVNTKRTGRAKLPEEQRRRLEAVRGWSWDARVDAFEEAMRHLAAFAARERHSCPPAKHVEGGYPLGRWVSKRRASYERIPQAQRERLEAMPGWSWNPLLDAFEEGFGRLNAFAAREGHARPLASHVEDGFALGNWVIAQRGARERMPDARRARLEALPKWTWDTFASRFEEGFRRLEAFVAREGHARPVASHVEDGVRLGRWVVERRTARAIMPEEQRAKLEALRGWSWDTRKDGFDEGLRRLAAYAARRGDAVVPSSYVDEDGFLLGQWVSIRRKFRERMTQEQRDRLEAVPGWTWRVPDAVRNEMARLGRWASGGDPLRER